MTVKRFASGKHTHKHTHTPTHTSAHTHTNFVVQDVVKTILLLSFSRRMFAVHVCMCLCVCVCELKIHQDLLQILKY